MERLTKTYSDERMEPLTAYRAEKTVTITRICS